MKIIVSEIPDEGLDTEVVFETSSSSLKLLSPSHAHLLVEKSGTEVFCSGTIDAEVELECGRCLKQFPSQISVPFNLVYHPVETVQKEEHHELMGDELDTAFFTNDELDTDIMLEEQIILSLPMKPLCSDQCGGICPQCGADLNTGRCGCGGPEEDSRFSMLAKLLERKE